MHTRNQQHPSLKLTALKQQEQAIQQQMHNLQQLQKQNFHNARGLMPEQNPMTPHSKRSRGKQVKKRHQRFAV